MATASAVLLEGLGARVFRHMVNGEPVEAVNELLRSSNSQLETAFVTAAVMEGLKPAWSRAIVSALAERINE